MKTMTSHVLFVFAVLCCANLSRATPVYANPNIIQFLTLEERCLFICNICFDKEIQRMGVCANTLCPTIDLDFLGVNQWIAKRCENYGSLAQVFFPKTTQTQI